MTRKKRSWKRILGVGLVSVSALCFLFAVWVNNTYAFEPTFISKLGFTKLKETASKDDQWTDAVYESALPISELEGSVVGEMKERGYDVDVSRTSQGYVGFSFQRAGWSRASLQTKPSDHGKTLFHFSTTHAFVRRAMIVLGIRS